jgi:SAM-dependent methyltransferase
MSADGEDTEQAEAEFDTMASWTADAVEVLGSDHAIPAGCRGSGGPAALRWLGERLGLAPGRLLTDIGAGIGGPAAFARSEFGVDALLLDPMEGACRAAHTMFGATALVASAEHLPLCGKSCEAVWSLGVLCSVDDLTAAVHELARVLAPDARLGLLVYLRTVPHLTVEPAANHFPSSDELDRVVAAAGLSTMSFIGLDELPKEPGGWQAHVDEVDRWIEREHRHERAWQAGHESEETVRRLIASGQVVGHLRTLRPG